MENQVVIDDDMGNKVGRKLLGSLRVKFDRRLKGRFRGEKWKSMNQWKLDERLKSWREIDDKENS